MKKKIVIGALLCAAGLSSVFGLGTGFAFDLFGKSTIESPLLSVTFTRGGDMQGSYHGMSVRAVDDKTAQVYYADAQWHFEINEEKEYLVAASVLEDIKTIFNENKLARCEKAPRSRMMVLDAATSSYSFHFKEKPIHFSSTQELSRDSYNALREIDKCVAAACEKGQRLPGLVLQRDADGCLPHRNAVVKGTMAIKVVGYRNKTLSISIGNGLETEKEISLQSKLTRLDSPDTIVAEKKDGKNLKIYPLYSEDYQWKLDDYLPAGQYALTVGDCTTEFEIK